MELGFGLLIDLIDFGINNKIIFFFFLMCLNLLIFLSNQINNLLFIFKNLYI